MISYPFCGLLIIAFCCILQTSNAQRPAEQRRLTEKVMTDVYDHNKVCITKTLKDIEAGITKSCSKTTKEYNERGNLIKMADEVSSAKTVFTITIKPALIISAEPASDTGMLLTETAFSGVVQHPNAPSIISKKDDNGLVVYQDSMNRKSPVPDTIIRLARKEKGSVIEKYTYQGQVLYFIPITYTQRAKLRADKIKVFDENYYDASGKIVAVFKRAAESMFMRAQHWEPASFSPSRLVKTGIVWKNTDQ